MLLRWKSSQYLLPFPSVRQEIVSIVFGRLETQAPLAGQRDPYAEKLFRRLLEWKLTEVLLEQNIDVLVMYKHAEVDQPKYHFFSLLISCYILKRNVHARRRTTRRNQHKTDRNESSLLRFSHYFGAWRNTSTSFDVRCTREPDSRRIVYSSLRGINIWQKSNALYIRT